MPDVQSEVDHDRLGKIENKLDKLIDAVAKFVLIEARVDNVEKRMERQEERHENLKGMVYRYTYMAIGGVTMALSGYGFVKFLGTH